MSVYEKMRKDLVKAKEGIADGHVGWSRTILEYVRACVLVEAAESLHRIDKHLSAIRGNGITVETFKGEM